MIKKHIFQNLKKSIMNVTGATAVSDEVALLFSRVVNTKMSNKAKIGALTGINAALQRAGATEFLDVDSVRNTKQRRQMAKGHNFKKIARQFLNIESSEPLLVDDYMRITRRRVHEESTIEADSRVNLNHQALSLLKTFETEWLNALDNVLNERTNKDGSISEHQQQRVDDLKRQLNNLMAQVETDLQDLTITKAQLTNLQHIDRNITLQYTESDTPKHFDIDATSFRGKAFFISLNTISNFANAVIDIIYE